ncbi:MAG: SMP-30/gluconolactonase/LRE family protein [Pseudomonadota bacterium]|nr:SMP-30/gluconolactonase/LRE family protein [Pseudomonadota bacterium]
MRPIAPCIALIGLVACATAGSAATSPMWSFEQSSMFPAAKGLMRPEDGLALRDGRIVVADQEHGLRVIAADQSTRPFGRFAAAGYVHQPPAQTAGPNGVSLEPDGVHALVADVFTGAIYRVNLETEATEQIYTHEFGVNTAVSDSTGAIWFTQSTRNRSGPDSVARLFETFDKYSADGALYRIPPPSPDGGKALAKRVLAGLMFANGIVIDEAHSQLYLAQTMSDTITAYRLAVKSGELSEPQVVATVSGPDNVELDEQGRLWVASPVQNSIYVIEPRTGATTTVFRVRTAASERTVAEWSRRKARREPLLDLFAPDMWTPLPGGATGVILTPGGGSVYVSGLGDALVKLDR